jgi:hypothetical protein
MSDFHTPDPAVDFEGCLDSICEQVAAEIKAATAGMSALEKARWCLARSGQRYLKMTASGAWFPDSLVKGERVLLDRSARRLVAILDEQEAANA